MTRSTRRLPILALCTLSATAGAAQIIGPPEHPFLIVRANQYEELQQRARAEPWSDMKQIAAETVATTVYDFDADVLDRSETMKSMVSAGALMYILEPSQRSFYKDRVRDALMLWDDLTGDPAAQDPDHDYVVGAGTAFFNSVLALDIIHNDLSTLELETIEAKLQVMADWVHTEGSFAWRTNAYGCSTVWALYTGDEALLDFASQGYDDELRSYISSGGVYHSGFQYAKSRTASDRDAKVYTMDVLEFTGHRSYYGDPLFSDLYEWLYGGSITPMRTDLTFGDTTSRFKTDTGPRTYNLHKFSDRAARLAAWALDGAKKYEGELLYYVLMDQPLPEAEEPTSQIWPEAYAAFWQKEVETTSLMAGLWSNSESSGSHSHPDTNGLHIAAFGESVLKNAGYAGWEKGVDEDGDGIEEFDWEWLHDTSRANSNGAIDRDNHASKIGGGIVEGFNAPLLDYASAYSGGAIADGEHWRNLVFVHPQDDSEGYFVVFDEFVTDGGEDVSIYYHPDSADYLAEAPPLQYRWRIQRRRTEDTYLTIFFGTPPSEAYILDGGMGLGRLSYVGKYVEATYPSGPSSRRNIVSVLFPHDDDHERGEFVSVSGDSYTGAQIDLGDSVIDTALESDGTSTAQFGNSSFVGKAALFREIGGDLTFLFVRQGTEFDDGSDPRRGFTARHPVSLGLRDQRGYVVAGETELALFYPDISGVLLDGQPVEVINAGEDWMRFEVPAPTTPGTGREIEVLVD